MSEQNLDSTEKLDEKLKTAREAKADIQEVLAVLTKHEKDVEARQAAIKQQKDEYLKQEKRLQANIKKYVAQKQGDADVKKSSSEDSTSLKQGSKPENNEIVTKALAEKLLNQVSQPTIAPAPKPPGGIVPNSVERIDRDLKLLAKVEEINNKLNQSSQNMRNNFDRAKGPKK